MSVTVDPTTAAARFEGPFGSDSVRRREAAVHDWRTIGGQPSCHDAAGKTVARATAVVRHGQGVANGADGRGVSVGVASVTAIEHVATAATDRAAKIAFCMDRALPRNRRAGEL